MTAIGDRVSDGNGMTGTVLKVERWRIPGQVVHEDIYVDWTIQLEPSPEALP